MPSIVQVTVHPSQFPENVQQALLNSLRVRQVNHKFLYDSLKQAQKWLALHEAYSPARTDPDCAETYENAFATAARKMADTPVHVIGLGCGGGQKDARLLQLFKQEGTRLSYAPCDVSLALVLVALQRANAVLADGACFPLVCDLAEADDCARLQQEAIQYHHRYICLFQLEDYAGVIRDTARNVEVFKFVNQYAESDELAWSLEQFCPQLLMMQTRAKGMLALREEKHKEAVEAIEAGLEGIRIFYRQHSRLDLLEQSGEIHSLEAWLQEIQAKRPLSERERLEHALDEAVRREDYEKAAQVRDALRNLKASQ